VGRKKRLLIILLSLLVLYNAGEFFHALQEAGLNSKRHHFKNKVAILLYHHIADKEEGVTISTEKFHSHLRALKRNGYHFISMEQFLAFIKENKPVPSNAVLITFDDGYESFYTEAYPILEREKVPATNFIVVHTSEHPEEAKAKIPHLTWEQMKEMKAKGHSFYSHTYDQHHYLPTEEKDIPVQHMLVHPMYLTEDKRIESPDEYKKRIKNDIALANVVLNEKLGPQPRLLAFPYGDYTSTVLEVAKEVGVELVFNAQDGINDRNTPVMYRINAGSPDITVRELLKKLKKYDE
jgi:biofilm PGA synthesis lipoprotein PgaB